MSISTWQLARERSKTRAELGPIKDAGGEVVWSPIQRRLQIMRHADDGAEPVVLSVEITGRIDVQHFEKAVLAAVDRHRILWLDVGASDEPRLKNNSEIELRILNGLGEAECDVSALTALACQVFNPGSSRTISIVLATLGERSVFVAGFHPMVADAGSKGVFLKEVVEHYDAFCSGRSPLLQELSIQFFDYAVWANRNLKSAACERQKEWWRAHLPTDMTALDLSALSGSTPADGSGVWKFEIPEALGHVARAFAVAQGATLFHVLLATFSGVLHRYTQRRDIAVVTSTAVRNRAELRNLIGPFTELIVLPLQVDGELCMRDLVPSHQTLVNEALCNVDVPFDQVIEGLLPAAVSSGVLTQLLFTFSENQPLLKTEGGVCFDMSPGSSGFGQFALNLDIIDSQGRLHGIVSYRLESFNQKAAERFAEHYIGMLDAALATPDVPIWKIDYRSEREREWFARWNETDLDLPRQTYIELFEEQARLRPASVAAWDEATGRIVTYKDLDAAAEHFAATLADAGAVDGDLVAVCSVRGIDFLAAILGSFKQRCAYLPLDRRSPPARLATILAQSGTKLIFADEEGLPPLNDSGYGERARSLHRAVSSTGERKCKISGMPEDLAYVIYTSGSTGQPKGAMVEQRGMLNHLVAKIRDLSLSPDDVVAQSASQCFDISVWQFLAVLMVGGQIAILSDETVFVPKRIFANLAAREVTVLQSVPALMREFLPSEEGCSQPALKNLRWMIATGEELGPDLAKRWSAAYRGVPLMNAYGPTECSDDVTHYVVSFPGDISARRIPIGKPVINTKLHVLDSRLQPVPCGVRGELFCEGFGVGRGYLNDPDRTQASFLTLPGEPARRCYRTGDEVCLMPDGNLHFLGRLDFQAKIRGFRIELGEIEVVLQAHPSVLKAVAIVNQETASVDAFLVAARQISAQDLLAHCREKLPPYMVPGTFLLAENIPVNANGKVDRKRLDRNKAIRLASGSKGKVLARNEREKQVAEVFAELLGVESIGIDDDFFSLGGNSLLLLRLASRLEGCLLGRIPSSWGQADITIRNLAAAT